MYYYQHHIGDFDRDTRHLTRIERSIYLDLIFQYYETEHALSLDIVFLCRKIVARTEDEKAAVLAVLDEYFTETPSGWFHDRCEEVIAEYHKAKSQASDAGKASAAARAERRRVAMETPTGVERRLNDRATTVERPLNDRATEAQRTVNEPSTNRQPTNNHKPETKNQEPRTENREPDPINPEQQPLSAAPASARGKAPPKRAEPGTGKVWQAYATAYWNRYGVEPVRNASVNGKLSQMVKRLGTDAEHVAGFYLTHRNRFYVEKMHAVGPMLADCEKLRTEWATSSQMTSTRAAQEDRTQTNYDAFAPLIAEAEARERGC